MVATSFFLWILSHSPLAAISCNVSFHLACISIKFSFLHGSYFILPCILSHSPLAAISCNISFLLACISLKFSFLHGSYFILPSDFVSFLSGSYFMQYFIPSGMYFNQIFISSWQLLHSPLVFEIHSVFAQSGNCFDVCVTTFGVHVN